MLCLLLISFCSVPPVAAPPTTFYALQAEFDMEGDFCDQAMSRDKTGDALIHLVKQFAMLGKMNEDVRDELRLMGERSRKPWTM